MRMTVPLTPASSARLRMSVMYFLSFALVKNGRFQYSTASRSNVFFTNPA